MKPTFIKKAIAASISSFAITSGAMAANIAIEEIVVTAQKRAESLQDIALSVSAFSGDSLREDDISSLQDIGNRTPGMVFSMFSSGQPEIAIRGIGTKEDGAAASDATVVSIDGVYIAARTAQVLDIFDLERVEVLRGPQGTLYGKNSIGGSINFITSKPTEDFTLRIRGTTGNYGRRDLGGMISGQLAEGLYGKVSFSKRSHDGYLRNLLNGKRTGDTDTLAFRGQLRWMPTDNLEVTFSADGADDDNGDTNREPIGPTTGNGFVHNCGTCILDPVAVNEALGGAGDPWTTLNEIEGFMKRNVEGYSLTVNWDLGDITFTSVTAYRENDFDWLEDSTGLPPTPYLIDLTAGGGALFANPASDGFAFDLNDVAQEKNRQYTQEFRLTSNTEGPIEWVAGLFYSKEKLSRNEEFRFTALAGGGELEHQVSKQRNDSDSWAIFGQGSYQFTEALSVTAGLRYSYEEKDIGVGARLESGVIGLLLKPFPFTKASEDWDSIDGKISVDWQLNDDVMLYGSVATGFKSGGFTGSASTLAQATIPFDEETALSYELGFKSMLLDRRLRLNGAIFFTEYEDLQVTRFFQPAGASLGEFITENAGEAEAQGVELEFTWLVNENIEVGGSYAYLDTEYTDFTGTEAVGGSDFSGNQLRQAPRNSANLYTKYTMDLGDDIGSFSAKVDYRYQDLSYYDPDENPKITIPQYRIWDARVAWNSPNKNWEVAGWIKNIGDEEYRTHIYSQRGGRIGFANFGAPRTSGVTVTYNY